ncbi:MAG TPA: amidohydrolase, partial [Blastocatellia bacterium]|nr:amidohydrolase [Blastocatellia bacterium]
MKRVLLACSLCLCLTSVSPSSGRRPERVDLIVRGATVVTMDSASKIVEGGSVAIRGDRIVAVGPDAQIAAGYKAARTIDATSRIVMPGLINTHTH